MYIFLFSAMSCFKWSTKTCLNQEADEVCKLSQKENINRILPQRNQGQELTFRSPGFDRSHSHKRIFCMYNISLECPSNHQTQLIATARTLPFEEGSRDYLAFYTDPGEKNPDEEIRGNRYPNLRMTLNNTSFMAVFWTDNVSTSGRFEIETKCVQKIVSTSTISNEEEYSESHEGSDRT